MSKAKVIFLCVVAFLLCFVFPISAQQKRGQTDQICQLLFDTYIVRLGKINTSTIIAASHIIAERGRNNGFWQQILKELQKGKEESEVGCVRILGKMLSIDAAARDAIRREKEMGELQQWAASVRLDSEVLDELIARGEKADRFAANHYAIALVRARAPRTVDFFQMILQNKNIRRRCGDRGRHYMPTAKFYAAVGLSQLGYAQGVEWLIENSENVLPTISCAWPAGVPDGNLSTSCVAALRMLAGESKFSTKSEWVTWWQKTQNEFQPKSHVQIVDWR